ncbi:MAG: hypothetical protein JXJ17_15240 [Anaerolineae bacterium]|nr:hypothetical protein [Anaerolineae bacterium]
MMNAPEHYEIHIKGHISDLLGMQFEDLEIRRDPDGSTVLSGLLDQSALHGILQKIRDLGLKLIAVNQVED